MTTFGIRRRTLDPAECDGHEGGSRVEPEFCAMDAGAWLEKRSETLHDGVTVSSSPTRRALLQMAAGAAATAVSGLWGCQCETPPPIKGTKVDFKPYRPNATLVPITKVTPDDGFYVHTYYDVCPFSPSQRYLAATKLPFQNRRPKRGETAEVCVIDLKNQTIRAVYETQAWGFQVGANVNWGASDRFLYTNDIIDGEGVCVRIDLESGRTQAFSGPMYHIAPDESAVVGCPLDLYNRTQKGYGMPDDPKQASSLPPGAAANDGVWRTDLKTGKTELLVSIQELAAAVTNAEALEGGTYYCWHSKFNRQGTRIMQVLRSIKSKAGRRNMVLTMDPDGKNIKEVVPHSLWKRGGHHPNWHPDGEHIIMNLKPSGNTMRFCKLRQDGSGLEILAPDKVGSGHPTVEGSDRFLLADTYASKRWRDDANEVPLRWIEFATGKEREVCRIYNLGADKKTRSGALRLDPHPAWSPDFLKVCFNGAPDGNRQLFIADFTEILSA